MGADAWVLVGGGYTAHEAEAWASRGFHCPPPTHPQASQTEQELQKELDGLRGQCQAQALAGAELRTQLESLQGEVSAGWGWGLSTQESGAGGSSRLAQHIPSSSEAFPQNQMLQSRRQDLEAQIDLGLAQRPQRWSAKPDSVESNVSKRPQAGQVLPTAVLKI